MIKYSVLLPVFLIIIFIFLFLTFIFFGKITYKIDRKEDYHFRNHFPYELNYQRDLKILTFFRIVLIFNFAFYLTINILFATSFSLNQTNLVYAIFVGLMFIFSNLVNLIIFFIPPYYLRYFKIYSTLSFAFSLLANGMLGVICLTNIFSSIAYKVIGGISLFIMALNVILMLNPKLKNWDKLEKKVNDDGTVELIRPRISYLALSQWLTILFTSVGEFLILLTILLNSLL